MALDTVVSNWNAEHRCGDEREALLSRPRQALGIIEEKDWRMLEISAWALGGRANSPIRTKLCPSVALRHAVYRELEYLVRAQLFVYLGLSSFLVITRCRPQTRAQRDGFFYSGFRK